MKVTVTERMFRDMFIDYNRQDNFSYEGLTLLFNYLEQLEQDTGEEMELDVISLCCDYGELTLEEFAKEYSLTYQSFLEEYIDGELVAKDSVEYNWESMSDEQLKEVVEEYLSNNTILVGFTSNDTVVFCSAF